MNLSFVQGDKYGSICSLIHGNIQVDHTFVDDVLSFPLYGFGFFVKNEVFVGVTGLLQGLPFNSIDQPICFYTNTMKFLFFLLCITA